MTVGRLLVEKFIRCISPLRENWPFVYDLRRRGGRGVDSLKERCSEMCSLLVVIVGVQIAYCSGELSYLIKNR